MMGNVLDVFKTDAFGFRSMIARIDTQQFVPGQALSLGIWNEDSINTEAAFVEVRDNVFTLVGSSPRGSSGQQITDGKRDVRPIPIPHLQQNSRIYAGEIAGVREFGTTDQMQTVESVVNRRLQIAATNFDGTLEHLAVGALQGIVYDADGSTVLADLYGILGGTKEVEATWTFPISASNAAGDRGDGSIKTKCENLGSKIRDNLRMGGVIPRIHAFVSPGMMRALTSANEVRTSYERYTDAASAGQVGAFLRDGHVFGKPPFPYGDIWFEEYRGGFIPDNKAIFFPVLPVGMPPLYPIIYAPADYWDTVNTLGRSRYAKILPDTGAGKFVDLETQTNPLPICLRPTALITTGWA